MSPCVRDSSWVKVTMVNHVRSGPALARDSVAIRDFRQHLVFINLSLLAVLQKGQLGDTGSDSTTGLTPSPQRAQQVRQMQDVPMMHPRHPLLCSNLFLGSFCFRQVTPGSAPCHPAQHPCVPPSAPAVWLHPPSAGTNPLEPSVTLEFLLRKDQFSAGKLKQKLHV